LKSVYSAEREEENVEWPEGAGYASAVLGNVERARRESNVSGRIAGLHVK
jgi:hypothetical protein